MEFDESYFIGEERAGFFVEEKMKRAWAAQLVVLKEIEKVCKKYGLKYYAGYGTMLGAVRHNGFIPWDDDIDIFMLRDDYDKLLKVFREEMPKEYILLNSYTDDNYTEVFSRIINSIKIDLTDQHMEKYFGCPYVVGIDIFPLDYLSRKPEEVELQYELYRIILWTKIRVINKEEGVDELLDQIEELCKVKLDRNAPIVKQLNILLDQIGSLYHSNESDEVTLIHSNCQGYTGRMKKEWFEKVVWLPFECTNIAVPGDYHNCLVALFGENYMVPVRSFPHDYPFYKSQDQLLQSVLNGKK